MAVRTHRSERTVALPEGFADGNIGSEAKAKCLGEERAEREAREVGIAWAVGRDYPVCDIVYAGHGRVRMPGSANP